MQVYRIHIATNMYIGETGQMGTQTETPRRRDRPGGQGSPGGHAGASGGSGAGSALGRSIGGGGGRAPPPQSGVMTKSPQRGRVRAEEGQRPHHCRLGGCGLGGGAAAPPHPNLSALPQSSLLRQPQSRHRPLPLSPPSRSASGAAGER